jgi:transposase
MSNKLIAMNKIKQILQWYTEGVGKKMITRKAGVNRNTVKNYIRQFIAMDKSLEEMLSLSDSELEKLFMTKERKDPDKRHLDLLAFYPEVDKALKKKGNTRRMLWEIYLQIHPDGVKLSQFNANYRLWSKRTNATMHVDHKSGDKMYVDYAGERLQIVDPQTAEVTHVEVFVAILGASQLTYVEATMTQRKEDFIGACENALHYFEGAPQAIVPDNLRSAVTKSSKYEPTLNESFRDFVEHYKMTALPAGPYKPRHKALVEGAVKIIYQTIYTKVRDHVFHNIEDLNIAIWEALETHNNNLLRGRPYSRRQMFEEIERATLQPLSSYRYELKNKRVATVSKNNYVCLGEDKHYYSVPYRYIGKKVSILYSQSKVDIYYRYEHIATHKRNRRPFMFTTVDDHLATKHKYQADWTPEKFIERAKAIGEQTAKYITEILTLRQHPEQAYKTCQGILNYAAKVGNDRLNAACFRAIFYGDYSYKTILAILDKHLDSVPLDPDNDRGSMPNHGNIRGNTYYA